MGGVNCLPLYPSHFNSWNQFQSVDHSPVLPRLESQVHELVGGFHRRFLPLYSYSALHVAPNLTTLSLVSIVSLPQSPLVSDGVGWVGNKGEPSRVGRGTKDWVPRVVLVNPLNRVQD